MNVCNNVLGRWATEDNNAHCFLKERIAQIGIEQATKMIDKLINYWLDNPMEGFKRGVELLANKDKIKAMAVAKAIREGVDPDKAMPILDKIIKNIPTIEIDL